MELTTETAARRATGRAIRDLGHAVIGHALDAGTLAGIADTLASLVERADGGPVRERRADGFDDHMREAAGDPSSVESYDDRPFSGLASPWGLDLDVHRHGDEIVGELTLRSAHEGAPGRAHGGIVAGLFDDVFGFVLGVIDEPAFTGELTIRYLAPTPLHRLLTCRGRMVGREGRKLFIEGELVDSTLPGAPVVAKGRGIFITVDPEKFAETMQLPPPPDEP